MKTFKVTFHGQLKGALGVCYWITTETKADDESGILLSLYDRYQRVIWIRDVLEVE